jgi:hypothetical protein
MLIPLNVHYAIAFLVAAGSVLLVWQQWGRRIMLYLLTVQILVGGWVIYSGLKVWPIHYTLALIAWFGYMAANAVGRRAGKENLALGITLASSVFVLIAFGIGMWAVKGG